MSFYVAMATGYDLPKQATVIFFAVWWPAGSDMEKRTLVTFYVA